MDPNLARAGWKEFIFSDISPARFRDAGEGVLDIRSRDGASILFRELTDAERAGRFLRWRWRVDQSVPPTDLLVVGMDDRDLAVHIWFPEENTDGVFAALGRSFAKAMGAPTTGKALSYIFGGRGERGQQLSNPFREGEAVYIILRPSGTDKAEWFGEKIDIANDYERAFGRPAPSPSYVAVSTDSDDTGTVSAGQIAGLRFTEK